MFVSLHVRESKTVFNPGFHAMDFGIQYWIADSLSVELGLRILIVSESPDSFFPEEKFPDSLTWVDMLIQTYITRDVLLGRPNFMITLYDY